MRLRLLLFAVILLGCLIQTQDALFTGGKTLQEHFESLLRKFSSKTSNKLQAWLDVLKQKRYANIIWKGYRKYYKRNYTSKVEENERFGKFIDNLKLIVQENFRCEEGNKTFRMKINEFGDMNIDEFRKKVTGLNEDGRGEKPEGEFVDQPSGQERVRRFLLDTIANKVKKKIKKKFNDKMNQYSSTAGYQPGGGSNTPMTRYRPSAKRPTSILSKSAVDYRPQMNPVENQGRCGSCYAFAVTAAIEGTHSVKSGRRVKLSKQQLVDCSPNNGCQGGYLGATFDYIKQRGGLDSDTSYPYATGRHTCSLKSNKIGGIRGYGKVQGGDEQAMKQALSEHGPLAAAIHTTSDLQFYAGSSGRSGSDIIDIPSCSKQVDHAIAIVGYGTENGKDYWIVRNSWGPKWGIDGYFKIARNKNMCGIATYGYYTIV